MGKVHLITGGVRSGKSAYVLSATKDNQSTKAFIATAIPFDNEMKVRIENHKQERDRSYITIEEPYDLPGALLNVDKNISIAIVDCLTVWLGNLFYKHVNDESKILLEIKRLLECFPMINCDLYMVTNEVGCGIVPENKMARLFRDYNGLMNQKIAAAADEVVLCSCGLALKLKG